VDRRVLLSHLETAEGYVTSGAQSPSSVSQSYDSSGTRFARRLLYSVPLSVVMWLLAGLTVLGLSI
jgi:hypothetical protein